jgi:hypothetical protein
MRVQGEEMINFGSHGRYEWLVADEDLDLLQLCPEIVLGKYLAITSNDSGVFLPKANEETAGWHSRREIAYSPKILSVESLPRSSEAYDEWYVFCNPVDLGSSHLRENVFEVPQEPGHVSVFVNYGSFALDRLEGRDLARLFWTQMEWVRPESYIADGYYLNFVSANKGLFTKVRDAVHALTKTGKPLI